MAHSSATGAANAAGEVYAGLVHARLLLALEHGRDLLVWSFGTRHTSKSEVMGFHVSGGEEGAKDAKAADAAAVEMAVPQGIVQRVCEDLFRELERLRARVETTQSFDVTVSFVSVGTLQEQCVDNLAGLSGEGGKPSSLQLREHPREGFFLEGLTETPVTLMPTR